MDLEESVGGLLSMSMYYRYVDDILIMAKREEVEKIFEVFNSYHDRLKFTIEYESDRSINFLDLSLNVVDDKLILDWFHKKTFSGRYLSYYSNHPKCIKGVLWLLIREVIEVLIANIHKYCMVRRDLSNISYPNKNKNIRLEINKEKNHLVVPFIEGISEKVMPVEFARKPRSLDCVKLWKATEYRLILCYTGPLAFKSKLKKNVYFNFLSLHVIVRILSSPECNEDLLIYAQELILFFIKTFKKLYGIKNVSHNVHNLVHLVDDVKKFGPLDNFSAFKYENYMQIIKKDIRKADRPLQQVIRRCIEKEINSDSLQYIITLDSAMKHPKLMVLHSDGPLIDNCSNPQYKIVKYNGITLKARMLADNCYGLKCGAIVCIQNIAYCAQRNVPVIIGYEFLEKNDFYNIPCPSSLLGIYTVHSCSNLKSWLLSDVIRKYVKLPLEDKYVVFPLLHTVI
ncbi:hypothetical protein ALC62_07533 [Cyphomyrmex costatus]|uniref:Reverse transcriptase domain-containing protein n=1 Tax=Cyphomyrmex costatus TaxID=456900 RepID=A0A151II49_9HYME|nr:hypothetical protein ALC62_07533 [Cyphomyrmex costatus]